MDYVCRGAHVVLVRARAECAFGELDQDGRKNIESFAAQYHSAINFMPVEERVYFVRDPTAL
jgi:hypothetical protein